MNSSMPYLEPSRPIPGFLHAAEGSHLGGDQTGVDADHAVFQRLGHPPDPADVAAVEIGCQAEFGVVGHLDRFCIGC